MGHWQINFCTLCTTAEISTILTHLWTVTWPKTQLIWDGAVWCFIDRGRAGVLEMSLDAINKESAVANHELFFIGSSRLLYYSYFCKCTRFCTRFILIFSITISWNQKHWTQSPALSWLSCFMSVAHKLQHYVSRGLKLSRNRKRTDSSGTSHLLMLFQLLEVRRGNKSFKMLQNPIRGGWKGSRGWY